MQTILGSGGAIGTELAKALPQYTDKVRLVSRKPKKVNPEDELFPADLLDPEALREAIAGSEVVFVTVGFEYKLAVWQANWPRFMEACIQACLEEGCKMVFFDNIYMYDANHLAPMDEQTPLNPPSKKGAVRARIATMILEAIQNHGLQALIARSADFYGPGIKNTSMLTETVFNNLAHGKKANWMGSLAFKHSFTYTPDAGKATALLGNTQDAYGQVWHLPTAPDPFTGMAWVEHIAQALGVDARVQLAPKWMVRILGLFMPIMKELHEMLYQYDRDYVFDSSKYFQRFGQQATPYLEGIATIVASDYQPAGATQE